VHFVRRIDQNKLDVRSKSYFVYKCSICKHEHHFNYVPNFDTTRLRKCPNCGVENDTNNEEYLIKEQQETEQKIKGHQEDLKILSLHLTEVQSKLKEFKHVHQVSSNIAS
jgi:DNA-directed RNA polymerase subunit RPC12/RpoP